MKTKDTTQQYIEDVSFLLEKYGLEFENSGGKTVSEFSSFLRSKLSGDKKTKSEKNTKVTDMAFIGAVRDLLDQLEVLLSSPNLAHLNFGVGGCDGNQLVLVLEKNFGSITIFLDLEFSLVEGYYNLYINEEKTLKTLPSYIRDSITVSNNEEIIEYDETLIDFPAIQNFVDVFDKAIALVYNFRNSWKLKVEPVSQKDIYFYRELYRFQNRRFGNNLLDEDDAI